MLGNLCYAFAMGVKSILSGIRYLEKRLLRQSRPLGRLGGALVRLKVHRIYYQRENLLCATPCNIALNVRLNAVLFEAGLAVSAVNVSSGGTGG